MTHIFLHIHKSGGTTLKEVLNRCYGPEGVVEIDGRRYRESYKEIVADLQSGSLASPELIKGHQLFGIHQHIQGQSQYFTMLREPISRTVSLFNLLRQIDLYPEINSQQMDLIAFAKSGLAFAADNGMVRFIGGISLEDCPYGQLSEIHLQQALQNLAQHFTFVGLSEQFDLSLLAMHKQMQWKRKPLYVSENVTSGNFKKYKPSEEEIGFLKEFLRFDIAIYNEVAESFESKIEEVLGKDYSSQLKQFKKELDQFQTGKPVKSGFIQRVLKRIKS